MKDIILIVWLILDLVKALFCLSGSIYLVLWKGCSGWWIVLAIVLCFDFLLYAILKKKYGIAEEEIWNH